MDNLNPEQIKQMIEMLKSMLPAEASDVMEEETQTTPKMIKQETKKSAKKQFVNRFDQMQEARLHKEDVAVDKALSVYAPTPRTRQFDPVEVMCRVCGRKETINPAILHEAPNRFKCNNCSRSPG